MIIIKAFFIVVLFLTSLEAVVVTKKDQRTDSFTLQYYIDDTRKLSFEEIKKHPFEQSINSRLSLGYLSAITWFKIDIKNNTNLNKLILYFNSNMAKEVVFYYQNGDTWERNTQGYTKQFSDHSISDKNPQLTLKIKEGQTKTVYIRMDLDYALTGEFLIYPNTTLKHNDKTTHAVIIVFFLGAFIMAIFFNLFLFITLKSKIYGYYVGYLIAFCSFVILSEELFFDVGMTWMLNFLTAMISLSITFLLLFINTLLNVKENLPKTAKVMKISAIIFIVLSVLIFFQAYPWFSYMNTLATPAFLLILYVTVRSIMLGVSKAKLYLFIWLFHMFFLGLMSMVYTGDVENNSFNMGAYLIIAFFETIAFTLILANRINDEIKEKLLVQNKLLEEKERYSNSLEDNVKKRTLELEKTTAELQKLSITDKLTCLYNRHGIDDKLHEEYKRYKRSHTPFGIILIDIDHFKSINDTYGHQIGDCVLVTIAQVLSENAREIDLVGRWGGEEFILITPQIDIDGLTHLTERLRKKVEDSSHADVEKCTASFGATLVHTDDTINTLLKRADENLYKAKGAGRNSIHVNIS